MDARNVSELYRDLCDARKIPKEEEAAFAMLLSQSSAVWHEAKTKSDFALFAPWLEKVRRHKAQDGAAGTGPRPLRHGSGPL